ncbi:MAG: hypothetical protein AB1813_28720, partial [Verrucomicrobiota bacterium]
LVGFSDGVLFVVRAGQTSMRFARNALAALDHRNAKLLGIVLNGITADNPYYYYHSYYHAYYRKAKGPAVEGEQKAPGRKMPKPKSVPSIEAEAKARAGQKASAETLAAEEQNKTEIFRARRAARRQDGNETAWLKKDNNSISVPSRESSTPNNDRV